MKTTRSYNRMRITPKSFIFMIAIITLNKPFKAFLTTSIDKKICIHSVWWICNKITTAIITRELMTFLFISQTILSHFLFLFPVKVFLWSIPIRTLTLWTNFRIRFISGIPLMGTAFTFVAP